MKISLQSWLISPSVGSAELIKTHPPPEWCCIKGIKKKYKFNIEGESGGGRMSDWEDYVKKKGTDMASVQDCRTFIIHHAQFQLESDNIESLDSNEKMSLRL